ncbi:uncharacterized protein BDV17DRAFT_103496 [Aspergillus undulatus]|uniref:uncharacterized protein n=1 Tax=Aspergillus undulatus TaxID=1810928 RepID=UPI003CCCABF7
MASEHKPSSPPSNTEEKDIPQTTPAASTNTDSAGTATAPSYAPIYATAQPSDMTVLPGDPTSTIAPPASISTSSSSPPPPQPGAVPVPPTQLSEQHDQSPGQTEAHPPPPAPAPKSGVAPTAAPAPAQAQALQPTQTQPPSSINTNPQPPIITAALTYSPAPNPTTSSSIYNTTGTTADPNTPQTAAASETASNSYKPAFASVPGSVPVPGSGYSYPSSYSYSPAQTQPSYAPQPPNATTTPYGAVYNPPTGGASTLPLHDTTSTGTGAGPAGDLDLGTDSEPGVWGNTKSWLASAGNKLAEVEAEVWRRINDAHDK